MPIHPSTRVASAPSPAPSPDSPRHRGWLDTAGRVLLAIPGSYALTAVLTAGLARLLPGGALSASLIATMLSFAVCAAAVIGIFAARSALRAVLWMALFAALGVAGIQVADLLRAAA